MTDETIPAPDTVERWAWDYIHTTSLAHKIEPPPVPTRWMHDGVARVVAAPGRPNELCVHDRKPRKTPGPDALRTVGRRVELLHTFWHHELQAAELMCRALLCFADAPKAFRTGLLSIAQSEIAHMKLYEDRIHSMGGVIGCEPVRDWFWQRVPSARTAIAYVATMGVGLEGANLDHTLRFASWLQHAGDDASATIVKRVGHEEQGHVQFATYWFQRFLEREITFDVWREYLPPPLSPMLMRGAPMDTDARAKAGLPSKFVEDLAEWKVTPRGPSVEP